jgi:fermentation-respiration switch protein FrsA (DUF1100 family)
VSLGCRPLAEAILFSSADTRLEARDPRTAGWRIVDYPTADGLILRGAILEHDDPLAVVVWFHGTGDCVAHNLERARALHEARLSLFLAEYRGYGGCPGDPSEPGLIADGRAALAAARRELGVEEADAVLLGVSLGTGVASALAAEGRGRAAVLIAPYTSIRDVAADRVGTALAAWCVPDLFPSLERLRRARQPVVVIHGTADAGIPFAHAERIAKALGERATLLPLEGAGHDDRFEPRHWRQVADAVQSALATPTGQATPVPPSPQ